MRKSGFYGDEDIYIHGDLSAAWLSVRCYYGGIKPWSCKTVTESRLTTIVLSCAGAVRSKRVGESCVGIQPRTWAPYLAR